MNKAIYCSKNLVIRLSNVHCMSSYLINNRIEINNLVVNIHLFDHYSHHDFLVYFSNNKYYIYNDVLSTYLKQNVIPDCYRYKWYKSSQLRALFGAIDTAFTFLLLRSFLHYSFSMYVDFVSRFSIYGLQAIENSFLLNNLAVSTYHSPSLDKVYFFILHLFSGYKVRFNGIYASFNQSCDLHTLSDKFVLGLSCIGDKYLFFNCVALDIYVNLSEWDKFNDIFNKSLIYLKSMLPDYSYYLNINMKVDLMSHGLILGKHSISYMPILSPEYNSDIKFQVFLNKYDITNSN